MSGERINSPSFSWKKRCHFGDEDGDRASQLLPLGGRKGRGNGQPIAEILVVLANPQPRVDGGLWGELPLRTQTAAAAGKSGFEQRAVGSDTAIDPTMLPNRSMMTCPAGGVPASTETLPVNCR